MNGRNADSDFEFQIERYWIGGNVLVLVLVGILTTFFGESIFAGLGPGMTTPVPGILWLCLLFYSGGSILHMFNLYTSLEPTKAPTPMPYLLAGGSAIFVYRLWVGGPSISAPDQIVAYSFGQAIVSFLLAPTIAGLPYLYKLDLLRIGDGSDRRTHD